VAKDTSSPDSVARTFLLFATSQKRHALEDTEEDVR
jgi:hypothetical protein